MNLTIDNCAEALNTAAINRKAAIQLELSVGLAVFLLHGGSNKDGRAMLVSAYAAAGYACTHIGDMDYKTINRRINATAALWEKVPVKKWVGKLDGKDALRAVYDGLAPYELFTIQDVMRYAAPQKVRAQVKVKPNADILSIPTGAAPPAANGNHTGQQKVMDQMRRVSDQVKAGTTVSTEHLTLLIPEGTPKSELIEMAAQLLQLAKKETKELLTA